MINCTGKFQPQGPCHNGPLARVDVALKDLAVNAHTQDFRWNLICPLAPVAWLAFLQIATLKGVFQTPFLSIGSGDKRGTVGTNSFLPHRWS